MIDGEGARKQTSHPHGEIGPLVTTALREPETTQPPRLVRGDGPHAGCAV